MQAGNHQKYRLVTRCLDHFSADKTEYGAAEAAHRAENTPDRRDLGSRKQVGGQGEKHRALDLHREHRETDKGKRDIARLRVKGRYDGEHQQRAKPDDRLAGEVDRTANRDQPTAQGTSAECPDVGGQKRHPGKHRYFAKIETAGVDEVLRQPE